MHAALALRAGRTIRVAVRIKEIPIVIENITPIFVLMILGVLQAIERTIVAGYPKGTHLPKKRVVNLTHNALIYSLFDVVTFESFYRNSIFQ